MSKGYTMSYFINEITEKVSTRDRASVAIKKLFPNKGTDSVKYQALCNWLGADFFRVACGVTKYNGLGKTSKTRLLKALKFRKKTGLFL